MIAQMTSPLATVGFVEDWWIQIIKTIVIFAVVLQIAPLMVLLERKWLGRFQSRYGPNRVGYKGALQPLADVFKLLSKEQFHTTTGIAWMMALAPAISVFTAIATIAIIPFGDVARGTVGLYGIDVSIGILWAFAFGALAFYGLMLGGWASGSKYSFLGAMRGAAQLISYEVALGLSLIGVVMTTGSLSLTDIVEAQGHMWFIVPQFVGFCIFLVAGYAETNRPPFDLPEADAELVGGYNTEYGGMRFGSFFMAEYINMIVISALAVTLFL
ncbi:MAG: NADH-quinone oxidoreductase subunit, partial [Thermoleophilaceae bacterium]|nr:NADH-quinone oxidoreductase subunit [Thermoleophilaceae bacterium]